MKSLLVTIVLFSSLIGIISCISVKTDKFQELLGFRCYNDTYDRKPLILGQNYPVGQSIENLISLIEKIETKRPNLSAQQLLILILQRFHIDGLQLVGIKNQESQIELQHKSITAQILPVPFGSVNDTLEDTLSEDEKCALFFTISHTVNETARYDEDIQYTYQRVKHIARAPARSANPSVTKTNQTLNTSIPVQSGFLTDPKKTVVLNTVNRTPRPHPTSSTSNPKKDTDEEEEDDKRFKRQVQGNRPQSSSISAPNVMTVTKMPREKGVASFRNIKTMAIAANRVLLGMAVGLSSPPTRTTRDIIKELDKNINTDNIPDGQIDPLLGVTLSDLLGIDAGMSLQVPTGQALFGVDGQWNSTACQTSFRLNSNVTLATLAELRGGLDGWNIGRKLPEVIQKYPKITLSQILRMYYSPRGLSPDSGVCQRQYGISTDLQNKVQREAENYLRIWNALYYKGSNTDSQVTGFIAETWGSFYQFLNKAGLDKTSEERDFCNPSTGVDIKTAPCESASDVFFMLDNMPAEGIGNKEEIEIITQVVKTLNLGRSAGSVSVLVNSMGSYNPAIVDDNNQPINPPLYALAYNTTSSQCASCRTAWFDNRQMPITDRPVILELINKTLMEFEMKKADLPAVPSKNFVWFDYGGLKPAPTEKEQKRKYDDFKWRLRYEYRDVNIFMAHLNKDAIKDLLMKEENYIEVGKSVEEATTKGIDLANKICQTPSTFQHNECRIKKSEDKLYEGFITPGYKQYWAMYPEFFIKSYNIDLKFKAEKQKIRVCFDRYPTPEREDRRCKEATEDGGEVKWTVSNPCQGKTFESCQALYFTIALSSQSGTIIANDCNDPRCRSLDQVKWSFTHSGVSCNNTNSLIPSWTFQLICFMLFLTIFFNNNKRN